MFFLYILLAVLGIIIIYYLSLYLIRKNALNKVKMKYQEQGYKVENSNDKAYNFIVEKDDIKTLVKVIYNFGGHEINVNSKNYFQRNKGVVSSRKKGNKIENVYDLIKLETTNKKVYLIYPDSVRMMKVINECEMIFIDENTDCYGTKFLTYKNIK